MELNNNKKIVLLGCLLIIFFSLVYMVNNPPVRVDKLTDWNRCVYTFEDLVLSDIDCPEGVFLNLTIYDNYTLVDFYEYRYETQRQARDEALGMLGEANSDT
jgi:hypothetical protein